MKSYHKGWEEKVKHLQNVYDYIKLRGIPNTDELIHVKDNSLYLVPRGVSRQPTENKQLLECLTCVLHCLIVRYLLHFDSITHQFQVAHGGQIFHRDIRWENIMLRVDDPSKWFVIDWEDAAKTPTWARLHLNPITHSPAVFQDNHGPEVDIWGVGHLMKTCTAFNLSPQWMALGQKICDNSRSLTAAEVLEQVNNCYHSV